MIAGHNGAGKSTCYRVYLKDSFGHLTERHIDPDAIEKEIRANWEGNHIGADEFSRLASQEATQLRETLFEAHASFSFETVFSDPVGEKVRFIERLRGHGYYVVLLFVALDSPDKSRARVAARHERGGHDVPVDRIYARYPRVLANAEKAVKVASISLVVDNSTDSADPDSPCYDAVAIFENGVVVASAESIPAWASGLGIPPKFAPSLPLPTADVGSTK